MTFLDLIALVLIFFLTSVIGVVTGSNSLITVPAMLHFGIEPRVALATNMVALTFLSVGGTLPFMGKGIIARRRLPLLVLLTVVGSIAGAFLVLVVPAGALPFIIALSMLFIAVFSIARRNMGVLPATAEPTATAVFLGYGATFALGIYGGFFSGGYVTLLTAVFVIWLGMSYLQSVATTKVINIFSSLVASLIFIWQGLVDYRLALLLSITMFTGASIGSRVVLKLDNRRLRRIFLATVVLLAVKTLYDVVS